MKYLQNCCWHMSFIPIPGEAEAGGSLWVLGHAGPYNEFQGSQSQIVRVCLKYITLKFKSQCRGSQKTNIRTTIWPRYITPGHLPKNSISCYRDTSTSKWFQPRCSSNDHWIIKIRIWDKYTMEFYLPIKERKKPVPQMSDWSKLYLFNWLPLPMSGF